MVASQKGSCLFDILYKMATRDIIQKWRDQGGIIRFKDGDKSNCTITNLEYVTIKEAMQNFEVWVTDWDLLLTKKEREVVMQETWRAGLYFSGGRGGAA